MTIEEKEQLLAKLHEDVTLCKEYLNTVHNEIVQQDISKYPIFVLAQSAVEIGKLIISKKELDISWNFYASHLENFVAKEIVTLEKVEEFQKVYKEHKNDFCLFVVMAGEFNFIFVPR